MDSSRDSGKKSGGGYETLDGDLADQMRLLEEENERLRAGRDHMESLETEKLRGENDSLRRELKTLEIWKQKAESLLSQMEQEWEHFLEKKELVYKRSIKEKQDLEAELKKCKTQLYNAYQEITWMKNFELENKSLRKDKTDLLEDLRK